MISKGDVPLPGALAPLLKAGEIVIWDNLQAHKSPALHEAIKRCDATIPMLPRYSPDLNPTEMP